MMTTIEESYLATPGSASSVENMPRITRILFPVDFSDSCRGAARYVEVFAGRFDAEVTFIHSVAMGERVLAEELLPGRAEQLEKYLAEDFKHFNVRRVCRIGEPVETIVEEASTWQPDLVMMPTHGVGYFRRHLLGSVTAKLLHDLTCPVWTSVHAEAAPRLEDIHCRRVLCAVDLGDTSEAVLKWAAWLAGRFDAKLALAHAASDISGSVEAWPVADELRRAVMETTKKRLAQLQAAAGSNAELFVESGVPSTVISESAKRFGADLIVIGRHSGAGLAKLFNAAYSIFTDSPCPVISV